jgi:hypothetical protein
MNGSIEFDSLELSIDKIVIGRKAIESYDGDKL